MESITITRPDDWHLHLRDGETLKAVLPDTSKRFARAIVMPNLAPPVTTTTQALAYRERILAVAPAEHQFTPLMTLYLTDNTPAEEIKRAWASGHVRACKLYPAGATTNSDSGVTDLKKCQPALEAMAELGMPLLIHGEVTNKDVDIFDREKVFIEQQLIPLRARLPELKIVFEHITTADACDYVLTQEKNLAATITAHHLLMNRNDMLVGGIRPHHYCLPVLKRERHRQALLAVIRGGDKRFFLGTDSAPHPRAAKETACGCAGMYTANTAIELYAEAFDQIGALDKLEAFASFNGPDYYQLPRNTDKITLVREQVPVAKEITIGKDVLIPLRAGQHVQWRLA